MIVLVVVCLQYSFQICPNACVKPLHEMTAFRCYVYSVISVLNFSLTCKFNMNINNYISTHNFFLHCYAVVVSLLWNLWCFLSCNSAWNSLSIFLVGGFFLVLTLDIQCAMYGRVKQITCCMCVKCNTAVI